jgi:hypothetical protein
MSIMALPTYSSIKNSLLHSIEGPSWRDFNILKEKEIKGGSGSQAHYYSFSLPFFSRFYHYSSPTLHA